MKLNLTLILSIIVAIGVVALSFTYFQILNERERLNSELEEKLFLIANRFSETNLKVIEKSPDLLNTEYIEKIL